MESFLTSYSKAAMTTLGLFWMALWAFVLGYFVSSVIQVFVTENRMKAAIGKTNTKSILLASFFGFISSSCSFSALATTKSLFKKGAGFIPSIAFLLASTNLVIELGIVISIFLAWQFVVGEYIGGILLILAAWAIIKLTPHKKLVEDVRKRLGDASEDHGKASSWKEKIRSKEAWQQTAKQYFMEWQMVWKDVTVGFTIAGIIAVFVPASFFETLFIQTGETQSFSFPVLLEHVVVGPVAAFCTFIGSMGNVPLASLLYANGVSFAGIMAFLFSDLVVFPVLRINAMYYGWKMSLYILGVLFLSLVSVSLLLHYGMDLAGWLPTAPSQAITERKHFQLDYTFFMNVGFLLLSAFLAYLAYAGSRKDSSHHHHDHKHGGAVDGILRILAVIAYIWLAGGVVIHFLL